MSLDPENAECCLAIIMDFLIILVEIIAVFCIESQMAVIGMNKAPKGNFSLLAIKQLSGCEKALEKGENLAHIL